MKIIKNKIRNYEQLLLFLSEQLGEIVKDVGFWVNENQLRITFEK